MSSSGHNFIFLLMCLMPVFFYMLERNLERNTRSLPSSCEFFPIESCSSLKACTSRLVLAPNEVRSRFEGKVSALVLRLYFLHLSSPIKRMATDGATFMAPPSWRHLQISFNGTVYSYAGQLKTYTQSFNRKTTLRRYVNFSCVFSKLLLEIIRVLLDPLQLNSIYTRLIKCWQVQIL